MQTRNFAQTLTLVILCVGVAVQSGSSPSGVQLASAVSASAIAAEPESDTTVAIGLTFKDPQIAQAFEMFENGQRAESLDLLKKHINDPSRNEKQRLLEMRAATSLLQIRDGDKALRANANSTLNNLVNNETDLARRAQVIKITGDDRVKNGDKNIADLKPRENWLERLRIVRRHLEVKLDEKDTEMDDAMSRDDGFTRIVKVMKDGESPCNYVFQMNTIKVERAETQTAITAHATRMRGVFGGINSRLRQIKAELQPLHHKWVHATKKAHKADRRDDYNKLQNKAKQWHEAGDLLRKHYQEMISKQLGVPPLGAALEDCPPRLN